MIDVKIYMVMGQIAVEVKLSGSEGRTIEAGTWYGTLDSRRPLEDLLSVLSNAFMSIDGYAGDVTAELAG